MRPHLSTMDLRAEVGEDTCSEPRERRAAPREYDAILLASFGGPESPEDVLPFLRNVTQGREDFGRALEETGLLGSLRIDKTRPYFNHPGFLAPMTDGIRGALEDLEAEGHDRSRVRILFSTHSIPEVMADASGPAEERTAGPARWYVAQHEAACRYLMKSVPGRETRDTATGAAPADLSWELVYQSRSGPPQVPWLEPDINDVITRIGRSGSHDAVVVVPVGFVSDHVEVIWDLDTEARHGAEQHDLAFRRVATSGTDPRFVAALGDLVEERTSAGPPRRTVTEFGATPDVCGTACCLSGSRRGTTVPTTSALDSDQDLREFRARAPQDGEQR